MTEKKKITIKERKIFSSQMKKYRLRQGINLKELSEISGFSHSYLSEVENSKRNITMDNAAKIAKALKVHLFMMFFDMEKFIDTIESELSRCSEGID